MLDICVLITKYYESWEVEIIFRLETEPKLVSCVVCGNNFNILLLSIDQEKWFNSIYIQVFVTQAVCVKIAILRVSLTCMYR